MEDTGGSWMGFEILIQALICSFTWEESVQNFSFLYWVLKCKELSCHYCLDWEYGGHWRFLIGIWTLNQGINMSRYPRRIYVPNFSFLHQVSICKELSCHYCPYWGCGGCWKFLIGVQNLHWGINMFNYLKRISIPNFILLYWVLRYKELSCPYCLDLACGGHWRFLIGVWSPHQGINMFSSATQEESLYQISASYVEV